MAFRSKLEKDAAYLYIPVDDNEEVQQAQYDVLDALNADLVTLEPQKPDRLHITLLFIEKVRDDDLEDFFNRLNLIMPVAFELEVVRTGTFPESDEKPIVLHLAPSPSLLRLQQELYDTAFSMGLPISVHSKPKFYSPHISLAYNYMPQDIKIPDLAAPFKIPIYNFVCTRQEYDVVRTIHLPNFHNEEVLVTRLLGGVTPAPTGQAQVSEADSTSTATSGARGKDIEDERIEQMLGGDEPDAKLPETVRIVYTPDLEIECRQTRSRDFVDIELGPPFWDIGDRGVRAGALAFQFGNIVADEMILGLGGAHEWSRADAMLQAPPKEQEAGFRFVFGTNSIIWAASYCYASYIINGPQEMQSRGYEDALRWIEIALEQYPDYDAENAPDFHSLIEELGDFPPEGVVPDYLIGKGGKGSGHHGHKGRKGEVGGSLPSGAGGNGKRKLDLGGGMVGYVTSKPMVGMDDLWEINQKDFRFEELREETSDIGPDFDMLDVDEAIRTAQEEIKNRISPILFEFMEDTGHVPTDIVFTDHIDPIFDEYWGNVPEEQRDDQWREVAQMLYGRGTKATYTGNEDFSDHQKFIHLNVDLMLDDFDWANTMWAGGELDKLDPSDEHMFRQTITHELGHWLSIEADTRRNPPDGFRGPDDEYKKRNRIFDDRMALSEYQADLIASNVLGDMGFRGWGRDLTSEETADRDLLMTLIDTRMAEKAALVEKSELPKPILAMIPWGDGYEGTIVSSNDLPEDMDIENLVGIIYRGGEGSGHHEHQGRPGKVGGSLPSGTGRHDVPPMRPRQPGQEMEGRRSKYGVRVTSADILEMSPEEVQTQIQDEYERAGGHGIRIAHEQKNVIDMMLQNAKDTVDPTKTWGIGIDTTEEEFIGNWERIINEAGGDADPRFVLATIRDINDAVEAGWLEIPEDVVIVIRRNNPNFDNNSQANYNMGRVQIFQNVGEQGDDVNASFGKSYLTLENWLEKDRKTKPLESDDWYGRATFTSEYFGGGMGAIVLHELGHHWDHTGDEGGTGMRAQELLDWGFRSWERATPERDQYDETSRRVTKLISSYATDAPGELAAEAYAISKHPDYETLSEYRRKFIEHMLLGTGEPLPRMRVGKGPAAEWLEEIKAEEAAQ